MDNMHMMRGAEPFFYPGNKTGCLVVHGFTATPHEVKWLGQHMAGQGYTVYGPRLSGHGTQIRDIVRQPWREWYYDVLAGHRMLRRLCDKIFVLGLSMGAALSFALAGNEKVDGVVGMSSFYDIFDWRKRFLPFAKRVVEIMPKREANVERNRFYQRVLAEQTRRNEQPIGHLSYTGYPITGLQQLLQLMLFMQRSLEHVTAPVLLIHSKEDRVAPFKSAQRYYDALVRCKDKRIMVLEDSMHVITEDHEREQVFAAAAEFVQAHGG